MKWVKPGIRHISTTTHCILATFAYYVCIKRRLPTRLYAICITVTIDNQNFFNVWIGVILYIGFYPFHEERVSLKRTKLGHETLYLVSILILSANLVSL